MNILPEARERIADNIRHAADGLSSNLAEHPAELLIDRLQVAAYDGDWPQLPTASSLCAHLADLIQSGGVQ